MSAFGFRVLVLAGMMGVGGIAGAQSVQLTASELTAKAELLGQQTFKRKSGDVLTFQKIRELPSKEQEIVLDDEMSEADFEVFDKYMTSNFAAALAREAEAKKLRDVAVAREAEAKKLRDVAVAREAEAKKLREVAVARADEERAGHVKARELVAEKVRQLIAIGIQVPPEVKAGIERDLKTQYIIDGLKPETLSFLKSVLARPELFRDK